MMRAKPFAACACVSGTLKPRPFATAVGKSASHWQLPTKVRTPWASSVMESLGASGSGPTNTVSSINAPVTCAGTDVSVS